MAKKIDLNERHQNLYNEVKKQVKKANQRLVRLERETGRNNSWAAKRLESKLTGYMNAWTDSARIRINKSMSITRLKAIEKATRQFNESKTSKVSGVRDTIKKQKEAMKESLAKEYEDKIELLSDEEINNLYDMMSDKDSSKLMEYVPASSVWQLIIDARENKDNETQFLERIETYIETTNDSDMKEKITNIYNKFII